MFYLQNKLLVSNNSCLIFTLACCCLLCPCSNFLCQNSHLHIIWVCISAGLYGLGAKQSSQDYANALNQSLWLIKCTHHSNISLARKHICTGLPNIFVALFVLYQNKTNKQTWELWEYFQYTFMLPPPIWTDVFKDKCSKVTHIEGISHIFWLVYQAKGKERWP